MGVGGVLWITLDVASSASFAFCDGGFAVAGRSLVRCVCLWGGMGAGFAGECS